MCGHVGIAGKLETKDENTLKRLLLFDYFRGPDSTGLAAIRNTREAKIAKLASHPLDLFEMGTFKAALSGYNSTVFIGHNRAATKGVVNTFNAHPYHFNHIVGAHNGTLSESSHKALEEKLGDKYPVDSMAIFAAIAKFGVEEVIPLLQGAWALVWYDQSNNSLNFLRNKERTFWYAYNKDFNRLFWASEWPTIDNATRTGGREGEIYEDESKYRFFATEVDVWYSIDVEALKAGGKTRPKPLAKVLKGKEPAPVTSGQDPFSRRSTGNSGGGSTHGGGTTTSMINSRGINGKEPPKSIVILVDENEPYGGLVKKTKFDELAKYGCSWCGASIEWGDKGITIHERDDIIRCADCSTGDKDGARLYVTNFQQLI